MRQKLLLILSCFIILFSCNKNIEPDPEDPTTAKDSTLFFSLSHDDLRSVSKFIESDQKDSLAFSDANGITYLLRIPRNALPADTNITITPFISASMTSKALEKDYIFYGALFEPAGLIFDTTLDLEVTFPQDFPIDNEEELGMVFFDTSEHYVGLLNSEWDKNDRKLRARLSHFSNYGATETDCSLIIISFNEAVIRATNDVFIESLELCTRLAEMLSAAQSREYNCAINSVLYSQAICQDCFCRQRQYLQDKYDPGEPTLAGLAELSGYFRAVFNLVNIYPSALSSQDVEAYRSILNTYATALAEEGRQLCGEGQEICKEGANILDFLLSYFDAGLLNNTTLKANILSWLGSCCSPLNVSMELSRTSISRMVIHADNPEEAYILATVTVTSSTGTPVEDQAVSIEHYESGRTIRGGTTNDKGKAEFVITSKNLDSSFDQCSEYQAYTIYASAYSEGQWSYSDNFTVTTFNIYLFTTINYNASASYSSATGEYSNSTVSVNGTTSSPARITGICINECEDVFTRAYSKNSCTLVEDELKCGTQVISDFADINTCVASIKEGTIYVENEMDGVQGIPYISKVIVVAGSSMLSNVELTYSGDEGTSSYTTDLGSPWPTNPDMYNSSIWHLENNGGTIEEMSWNYVPAGAWDHIVASMTISVDVSTSAK